MDQLSTRQIKRAHMATIVGTSQPTTALIAMLRRAPEDQKMLGGHASKKSMACWSLMLAECLKDKDAYV
jgi:hypothetical protein